MTLQQSVGYQKLVEKFELYEFSFRLVLFFNIFLHCIPVGSFADRCDIIAIGPKLATPKLFLYCCPEKIESNGFNQLK